MTMVVMMILILKILKYAVNLRSIKSIDTAFTDIPLDAAGHAKLSSTMTS